MAKKLGIIAEDDSDVDVIKTILCKYLDEGTFSIKKFIGNGCGALKNKCDSWAANLVKSGCEHILLFHDLDRNLEPKLRKMLIEKLTPAKFPKSIIVIPIEELEGWLLSDNLAIQAAFNLPKLPRQIHDCESISSPKEHLRDMVWYMGKKRYINTIHNKKIAEHMSIANLMRCESYVPFDTYINNEII